MPSTQTRCRGWLTPAVEAVLLCAVLWVLHGQLQAIRYRDLQAALARLGADHLLLALLCCAVGFALLSGTAVRHRFYARWGESHPIARRQQE